MSGQVVGDLLTDVVDVDKKRVAGAECESTGAAASRGKAVGVVRAAIERVLYLGSRRQGCSELLYPCAGKILGRRGRVEAVGEATVGVVGDRTRNTDAVFCLGQVGIVSIIRK